MNNLSSVLYNSGNESNPPAEKSILEEALEITRKNRQKAYSHPIKNFARVAQFWEVYLMQVGVIARESDDPKPLTAEHVAQMMVLFKIARDVNLPKRDNIVDEAGYVDCVARIDAAMKTLGYEDGIEDLRSMTHEQIRDFNLYLESVDSNDPKFDGV